MKRLVITEKSLEAAKGVFKDEWFCRRKTVNEVFQIALDALCVPEETDCTCTVLGPSPACPKHGLWPEVEPDMVMTFVEEHNVSLSERLNTAEDRLEVAEGLLWEVVEGKGLYVPFVIKVKAFLTPTPRPRPPCPKASNQRRCDGF